MGLSLARPYVCMSVLGYYSIVLKQSGGRVPMILTFYYSFIAKYTLPAFNIAVFIAPNSRIRFSYLHLPILLHINLIFIGENTIFCSIFYKQFYRPKTSQNCFLLKFYKLRK